MISLQGIEISDRNMGIHSIMATIYDLILDGDIFLNIVSYCGASEIVALDEVCRGAMVLRNFWEATILPAQWRTFDNYHWHCHDSVRWIASRNIPIETLVFDPDERSTLSRATFDGIHFAALKKVDLSNTGSGYVERRTIAIQDLSAEGIEFSDDVDFESLVQSKLETLAIPPDNFDRVAVFHLISSCHATLESIILNGCQNMGQGSLCLILSVCKNIKEVVMNDVDEDILGEDDMNSFAGCVNLERITWYENYTDCGGNGFLSILSHCPNLRCLDFGYAKHSDNTRLGDLRSCRKLEFIRFHDAHFISDGDIFSLRNSWSNLRVFRLWNAEGFTELGLKVVLMLPAIEEIEISCCQQIHWAAVNWSEAPQRLSASTLRHLTMYRCSMFTDADTRELIKSCPNLVYFQGTVGTNPDSDSLLSEGNVELLISGLPNLRFCQYEGSEFRKTDMDYFFQSVDEEEEMAREETAFQQRMRAAYPRVHFYPTRDMSEGIWV
mmetsp:Transcript_15000/g.24935  ORF Transcript_15000/g.24935 Transcript_15000/m.24935 type:complete len:496 (+) Transcript_15000:114-1601(+)